MADKVIVFGTNKYVETYTPGVSMTFTTNINHAELFPEANVAGAISDISEFNSAFASGDPHGADPAP